MADIKLLYAHRIKPDKMLQLSDSLLQLDNYIRIGMLKLYRINLYRFHDIKEFCYNKEYKKKQVISVEWRFCRTAQPINVDNQNIDRLVTTHIYALRKCDD